MLVVPQNTTDSRGVFQLFLRQVAIVYLLEKRGGRAKDT